MIKIYHFTHINNLFSIFKNWLFSDNNINKNYYTNIGSLTIKEKRRAKIVFKKP